MNLFVYCFLWFVRNGAKKVQWKSWERIYLFVCFLMRMCILPNKYMVIQEVYRK